MDDYLKNLENKKHRVLPVLATVIFMHKNIYFFDFNSLIYFLIIEWAKIRADDLPAHDGPVVAGDGRLIE
ncbi:hypothetical protein [Rhizobium dioscoreae]|uniref:hypothetical protein n=1 Tax=Rhizobium dioscoreae TaxID=2653122 RepID=UPI0012606E07|nr:hypothetical protein [Rhizobium dioscoreae]